MKQNYDNFNDKIIKNIINLFIIIKNLNLYCDLILGIEIKNYNNFNYFLTK